MLFDMLDKGGGVGGWKPDQCSAWYKGLCTCYAKIKRPIALITETLLLTYPVKCEL